MKVGKLTFVNICGPLKLVCGPGCCGNLVMWFICYGLFGGFFIGMTIGMDDMSKPIESIMWSLIAVVSFCFFYLILSDPGVPNQILKAARGDTSVVGGISIADLETASKETLLT